MNWDLKKEKLNFLTHQIFIVIRLPLFRSFFFSLEFAKLRLNVLTCSILHEWKIMIQYNILTDRIIIRLIISNKTKDQILYKNFTCICKPNSSFNLSSNFSSKEKMFCQCKWIKINGAKTTLANCFHSTRMYDDVCPSGVFTNIKIEMRHWLWYEYKFHKKLFPKAGNHTFYDLNRGNLG